MKHLSTLALALALIAPTAAMSAVAVADAAMGEVEFATWLRTNMQAKA